MKTTQQDKNNVITRIRIEIRITYTKTVSEIYL